MSPDPRRLLLDIYAAALRAVDGRRAVRERLVRDRPAGPVQVVAVGKAAAAMAAGAADALGDDLAAALVITRHGYADPGGCPPRTVVLEADHPLPGAASLAAGQALLDFIAAAPAGAPFLFLISGGTSALVEVLPPGVGAAQLHAANEWLLASGWDIGRVNRVRRALSCIKGGRLAQRLTGRPALNLLLSDVPGDDLAAIGSGLLVPPAAGAAEPAVSLPPWLQELVAAAPPPPRMEDFGAVCSEILRGNGDAREAAAAAGRDRGLVVHQAAELLQGDAAAAGRALAAQVLTGPAGLYVWGGETTVRLPPQPGRGGRCQSLALAAAQALAGRDDICLLAAGTDGSDGPGEDAGALVDGATVERGTVECFDARESLARADAGSFLEASGDLIQTGPTGSNVMDLVLALKPV
jgi:glycerate 2-kinase